jgi:hypothetical protein
VLLAFELAHADGGGYELVAIDGAVLVNVGLATVLAHEAAGPVSMRWLHGLEHLLEPLKCLGRDNICFLFSQIHGWHSTWCVVSLSAGDESATSGG